MFDSAPTDDERVNGYIDAWCAREALILGYDGNKYRDDKRQKAHVRRALHDNIYENLDTLDGKAGAFMQAASVIFAINSFVIQTSISTLKPVSLLILVGTVSSAAAVALCMNVIYVRWTSSSSIQSSSFESLRRLVRLKSSRTRNYIISYWMLCVSFACLAVFLITNVSLPGVKIGP